MSATKRHLRDVDRSRGQMEARDREVDRSIASRFRASFMSDAKWARAFGALAGASGRCRWKFADEDRVWESRFPPAVGTARGYFEVDFGDVTLKHVEWVEIFTPDPESAVDAPGRRGHFEIERSADGIRLYGYL